MVLHRICLRNTPALSHSRYFAKEALYGVALEAEHAMFFSALKQDNLAALKSKFQFPRESDLVSSYLALVRRRSSSQKVLANSNYWRFNHFAVKMAMEASAIPPKTSLK